MNGCLAALYVFNLDTLYVNCIQSFFAILHFERHTVVLANFVNQTRLVHEDVLVSIISNNETETFRNVEKLYFTCFHYNKLINNAVKVSITFEKLICFKK